MKTVLDLNDKYLRKLIEYYHSYEAETTSPHMKYLFKSDDFTITVYHSNKVLFQGAKGIEEYEEWAKLIGVEPQVLKPIHQTAYMNEYYNQTVIGSDEVGTGDFFGPVVVTAALVGKKNYAFLNDYNIQDSKNISDRIITEIAPKLMQEIPHHTLVLNNEKYNSLTKQGYNMNKIKAYLHNHAIKKMMAKKKQFQTIIVVLQS